MFVNTAYLVVFAIYFAFLFYFGRWIICSGIEMAAKRKHEAWTKHRREGNK